LIPPFDHYDVIAGQGTIGLELLEDYPDLDAIVVPVGGGGMISGITVASKAMKPSVKIVGAEPWEVDDASRSKLANQWQPLKPNAQTIADGLTTTLGQLTWPIIQRDVNSIITVTESEIRVAMKLIWERMKLVIEPSAGVGIAVVLTESFKQQYGTELKKVAVILCGGNVSLDKLYW
jgi:threonine dehydratase